MPSTFSSPPPSRPLSKMHPSARGSIPWSFCAFDRVLVLCVLGAATAWLMATRDACQYWAYSQFWARGPLWLCGLFRAYSQGGAHCHFWAFSQSRACGQEYALAL
ncbi:hypothetical protein CoHVHLJ_006 [Columbid alphaherpesvirus 1]|uniref:Uncharacterized protein n=1 Tax=Columbid alphaherpesvirus 1 TaxID=93386 RepID=A0A1V0M8D3_9ALPH|nr:hypothetical protein CoHVHLJ_006 [Columbid alphaherpesvirus 1]ARD71317.1 hypothetical protein CoHVHLJ_006 [Columbid alphaherpesvirus 1]